MTQPMINWGDGSDVAVASALWCLAERQGLIAACSATHVLSAFDIGFNVQFDPDERRFRQKLLFVLLDHLGCAFYDDYPIEKPETLVGLSLGQIRNLSFPVQIAVLDSLFAAYQGHGACDETVLIEGTHREKALRRTEAICAELCRVRSIVLNRTSGCTANLIGVSNLQARILGECGFTIQAWDRDPDYAGHEIAPGIIVRHAGSPEEQVQGADILLISGMTIANNTLPGILLEARKRGIPSVCWAVTAANLAPLFRGHGLTSVISEPFPPYFLPGETHLRIFREAR